MTFSFLVSYRVRVEANKKSIYKLFNSIKEFFGNDVEILLKTDTDDTVANEEIVPDLKKKYPFDIKVFTFRRWEGVWSIHHFYMHMLARKNPETKFIVFAGDDMYFIRDIRKDIEPYLQNKYCIIGDFKEEMTKEKMKSVDYHTSGWTTPSFLCSYPIVSSNIFEIMGHMGWQTHVDSMISLINLIIFQKYNIILSKHISNFLIRDNIDRLDNYGNGFTDDYRISSILYPLYPYFFTLSEQVAKNIYLNIKLGEK